MSRCIVPFLLALLLAAMTTTATAAPIVYGVNAHDNRPGYSMAQAEARFQLLAARNLRSYRFDVDPRDYATLDALVPLARKYGITLRPMVYPMSREIGYQLARRYAADIKVWEIGNEQDLVRAEADARIAAMTTMYLGMRQASNELGAGLRFTINITACNSDDRSANARCPGDRNGSLWFLAKAKAAGFNFDHISFHYYAFHQDAGYWSALYLGQLRTAAQTYKTPVFFNELNCAEIYTGNTHRRCRRRPRLLRQPGAVAAQRARQLCRRGVRGERLRIAGPDHHPGRRRPFRPDVRPDPAQADPGPAHPLRPSTGHRNGSRCNGRPTAIAVRATGRSSHW